jgi:hypothetical protein
MTSPTDSLTQRLSVAALLAYAGNFIVSQPFYADADSKLTALLRWSHYGSLIPRLPLWYISAGAASGLVIGLLAVVFRRSWGAWFILGAMGVGVLLVPFEGVVVESAVARTLGGIAMFCILAILAIHFLRTDRK